MGLILRNFPGTGTFAHGVHPPERKNFSADLPIEVMPTPEKVSLPVLQNIGAPCNPVVKPRQEVSFGDIIGQKGGFVSASLHAPISGKVLKLSVTTLPNARHVKTIPIKASEDQITGKALWDEIYGGKWPKYEIERYMPDHIVNAIADAGIVGHGGATFPAHVKLMPNPKKPVNTVLINGCECEPYLTTDYRLMVEAPKPIITGALLAARATGAKDIIIGIEDNKPEAITSIKKAASGTGIKIAVLKTKYPQGSEKQLIMAILKREVPFGGLPLDVGVAVNNVATAAAIARAVIRGKPVTHRVVSVTGGGIVQPKNLLVPIGISYRELIDYCGGLKANAARVISGGPMMGFAFTNLDVPVTKGTSGITVLTHDDISKTEKTACVRCGRCVDVCPMHLVPTRIALASRVKDWALARRYHIMACFECGSCTYICPANIPLIQLIRMGKTLIMAEQNK
ncbi:Proton-translocating ferredoxin:NAD(+) oxidoreductase complex subunit C [Candidatus Magnetomoraceae bacterium gMMP-1]